MTDNEMPAVPVTGPELAARWAERDAQYAKRRTPLTQDEAIAVQLGRMREADFLPVAERARMFAKAQCWVPPVHPEFGSMKDWLE